MARRALGRGLNALISQAAPAAPAPVSEPSLAENDGLVRLPLERVRPSPWQPRTVFDPDKLASLADSIREQGLVQPVVVRKHDDYYELIAGERRYRAVTSLGWEDIPAVVMEASDKRMRELALVENLQRDDLNPIETAMAYQSLQSELGLTHEEIATHLGISRAQITNTLRLLDLPQEIRSMVAGRELTQGHARALLALPDDLSRMRLAKRIVADGLSVRQVEQLVQPKKRKGEEAKPVAGQKHPAVQDLEERLARHLSTRVSVLDKNGRGHIRIEYYNHDDVARILQSIGLHEEL